MLLMVIALCLSCAEGMKVVELSDDPRSLSPLVVLPSVNYQIINADYLLLRDTSQDVMDNSSLRSQRQPFILTGLNGQPAINVSYGPMSLEQSIPLHMIHTGPRIRPFILTHQVRPSTPALYVLFYATSNRDDMSEMLMQNIPGQNEGGYLCVTAYAFWESREVRDSCSISADGGFCLVHLKPEPAWFNTGGSRSSWEQRGDQRGNVVELYYQIRPSPSGQCVLQESKIRRGTQHGELGRQIYGTSMKRIGTVNLLRSPPGNPTFMRLRLGGAVIIKTSSKPLKTTDTATFYVFLTSTSPVEHFILKATSRKGMSFSTARPSDAHLWDITLEPARGSDTQTISVTCQKKSTFTSKRVDARGHLLGLEVKSTLKPNHPSVFVITVAHLLFVVLFQDTELLNTAVLTGKRVSVPVKVLGVEADGSITDITNSSHCRSSDQDVLKVSERCDSVYVNGKETCGRVRMMVNFTYSYLSTQLEVSVWMPRLPLHMEISDPELSQIKAWRVPVTGNKRVSWDTEEEDERKGRGCMLQYQHSLIRVLTVFTAESPDPSSPSPAYFLGSDWQVDVTWLVRYFLRVGDTSVARLQAGSVLTGKAVGVTTVQVISPLSDSVLAERMIRVLDDKVSITELGVQLVSGLSLNLQLSPGRSRAIVAKTTTQEIIHYPKQEAVVGCWLKFSDGSQTPLDLFDPSGYSLTISSLNPRVASVRKIPGSVFVVVAEAEGQGLLLRAELAICEACQKSKRKSKLAVGGGMVKVKFPPDEQLAGTGKKESEANDGEDGDKLILTSPLNTLQHTVIQESTTNAIKAATKSNFQEAIGDGVSTIKSINTMDKTLITKPVADRALVTVGPRSPIKNGYGNLLENANFPFPPEEPKREPPLVESDLIQMFSVFTDIEVCIYALVGLSCLAVIAILLHCATNSARSRSKKSPVQCQGQSEHKHHWVRLGTVAEQNRAVPIATTSKQEMQAAVKIPRAIQMQNSRGPETIQPREIPAIAGEERTATLGRRTNTLPPRRDPMAPLPLMAVRSATLLARPVRSEPLHSPTSKRNQVQFTTFATLDIKHLAALKNGQNFSWASQPVGGCQAASIGQGGLNGKVERVNHVHFCSPVEVFGQTPESKDSQGFLPEGPWPVATPTPVSKV
ncbi:transmembrane protein 132D-like [Sinocyclocheilus rhinocerous]|uniref:transmembrane protein 132D-like n=1 Tax=Sinocyclocheilus rhinocerous TaxID=307959 RepID=UPI0007B7F2C2|nr:PREDICTED: transmembrane protein 132D-like [Sinocyclocheilus rhinocerous]